MKVEIIFIKELKREITYYIGKNKHENFQVIDKGNPDDLWFHAATRRYYQKRIEIYYYKGCLAL
jgi:hypothetical protein